MGSYNRSKTLWNRSQTRWCLWWASRLLKLLTSTRKPDVLDDWNNTWFGFRCSETVAIHGKAHKNLCILFQRIFWYLNGTSTYAIQLCERSSRKQPIGFWDADYNGCLASRQSANGFIFTNQGGAISWRLRKQTLTAESTAEAEYISLATATQEAVWLRYILSFERSSIVNPNFTIYINSQAAMKLEQNDSSGNQTKQKDIEYYINRSHIPAKHVNIKYCNIGIDSWFTNKNAILYLVWTVPKWMRTWNVFSDRYFWQLTNGEYWINQSVVGVSASQEHYYK